MSLADQRLVARFRSAATEIAQSLLRRHEGDPDAHAQAIADAIAAHDPVPDTWHRIGAPGEPTITAPFTIPDPVNSPLEFRKDSAGNVHIRGVIQINGGSGPLFTLPASHRPLKPSTAFTDTNTAQIRKMGVSAAGVVDNVFVTGPAATYSQCVIIFSTS